MKILEGKKSILFPMQLTDIDYYVDLHIKEKNKVFSDLERQLLKTREDVKEFLLARLTLPTTLCWVIVTKEGKASKKVGFVLLTEWINKISVNIHGVMDTSIYKGLLKKYKDNKEKVYIADDAYRTVVKHCFKDLELLRVGAIIAKSNRLAIQISKRIGLKKEGEIRNAIIQNGKPENLVLMSILKEEFKEK